MPDSIVINTGPLIALVAATGGLDILKPMYREVLVPSEVAEEIGSLRSIQFVQPEFSRATWLVCVRNPVQPPAWLANTLDRGEAAVIHLALERGVSTVCIDEAAGRRMAQLCGLKLTGSVGILLRHKKTAPDFNLRQALEQMRAQGVWISAGLVQAALRLAGEETL